MSRLARPYQSGAFVGRLDQIEWVRKRAQTLATGVPPPATSNPSISAGSPQSPALPPDSQRVVIFEGEVGTGKTWLLMRLQQELLTQDLCYVHWLDLNDYARFAPMFAVMDVLKGIAATVTSTPLQGTSLADMNRHLMELLRPALATRPLVLLVDHVYEAEQDLLERLEEFVLSRLAPEPRILILMAGRGREADWGHPLLIRGSRWPLEPFDEKLTAEQVAKISGGYVNVNQVYKNSGGVPLANYVLSQTPTQLEVAMGRVLDVLLEKVPAEERQGRRRDLLALSIVNEFDEDRTRLMLATYAKDSAYLGWTDTQAVDVWDRLVAFGFASSRPAATTKVAMVIDPLTRFRAERYLYVVARARWRELHCAAQQLYLAWVSRYATSPTAQAWQAEADYHKLRCEDRVEPTLV